MPETTHPLSSEEMAHIISQSRCSDIQDAIAMMEEKGFSVQDLSKETLESVLGVVASAESIGAQAGITPQEK